VDGAECIGKGSNVLTSNRPLGDWYAIFPDPMVSSAIELISTDVMGNSTSSTAKSTEKAQT
jgi:energy-converting hydrogenase Eha subunit A